MKQILKSIIVAFSIYSKIPMPGFEWKSEDMRYHLLFFPWVGAFIGALEWGLFLLTSRLDIGNTFSILISFALPLLVTGGFHMDGFMDTCDALHSYQDREKKLEILKDPHIGAFAVICLLSFTLVVLGFLSLLDKPQAVAALCISFFLSRSLSGISVVTMKSAKKDGMLQTFGDTAARKVVCAGLFIELAAGSVLLVVTGCFYGIAVLVSLVFSYLYYYRMSRRNFGGITGDLAGFFVTVSEGTAVVVVAVLQLILSWTVV